jgi:tetratricopeptide (TPR) repeat protein
MAPPTFLSISVGVILYSKEKGCPMNNKRVIAVLLAVLVPLLYSSCISAKIRELEAQSEAREQAGQRRRLSDQYVASGRNYLEEAKRRPPNPMGPYNLAIKELNSAYEIDPANPEAKALLIEALLTRGMYTINNGARLRPEDRGFSADADFEAVLRIDPTNSQARLMLQRAQRIAQREQERVQTAEQRRREEQEREQRERREQNERARRQQEQAQRERQEREALARQERARGYVTLSSEMAGTVLFNGSETELTVTAGGTVTLTIENAAGEYEVAVRDSGGRVWETNTPVSIEPGASNKRRSAYIESPDVPANPDEFEIIQNVGGGITITGYKGRKRNLVIPGTISGIRVTEIGGSAFNKSEAGRHPDYIDPNSSLLSVVIPDSVTVIGNYAFRYNRKLISVTLPSRLSSLGESAFFGCKALPSITLPNTLTSIENDTFSGCTSLSTVIIPNAVTIIKSRAFYECALTSVTLSNRLTIIEGWAFSENAIKEVTFPPTLRAIRAGAFYKNQIETLVIPNGVTLLAPSSFEENPITRIVIPPSLAKIDIPFAISGGGGASEYRAGFVRAFAREAMPTITSITLPADVEERNLAENFDPALVNFWISQNKRAGTYVKEGRIWTIR